MNASFPLYMDADAEPGEGVEDEGWAKDGQQGGKQYKRVLMIVSS